MVNNGTLHGADVRTGCYAIIPGVQNNYGYVPSLAAGIVFCTIFAISMAGHFVQGVRKIRWTSFLLAIGALGSCVTGERSHSSLMRIETNSLHFQS